MNCENAELYYYDLLEAADTVPAEIGRHIEHCAECQRQMAHLREEVAHSEPAEKPWRPKLLQLHYQLLDQWLSCEQVRPFLPSLLVPQLGFSGQTPVTAHVANCPACRKALNEISALRLTADQLIEASQYLADGQKQTTATNPAAQTLLEKLKNQARSTVLTRMRLDPASQTPLVADSTIVEVKQRHLKAIPHQKSPRRAVSAWVTSGIAAAVIFAILVAVLPTGKLQALDVEHLYATIENVQNVRIQKFYGSEELETIWIAERLGGCLYQQSDEPIFVDTQSGNIFQRRQGAVQVVSQGGKMELERPWGLLPFKHISQVPQNSEWNYVSDDVLEGTIKVRIYEWTWKEVLADQTEMKRIWRGYLDAQTHLPYRVECLDQIGQAPAEVIMEMKISYPSDAECRDVFEQYGFGQVSYGAQHERLTICPSESKSGSTEDGFFLSTWPSVKTALSIPLE